MGIYLFIFFTFLTPNSDPGKKINIGCNLIISWMERLELLEFPRYNILVTLGKTQKPVHIPLDIPYPYPTFQKQSVSVPYPHQISWNSSVPVPVPNFKKFPYPSCLRTKNQFFFPYRSVYASVLGYGCVDVDGFRLHTPGPAVQSHPIRSDPITNCRFSLGPEGRT